MNNLSEEYLWIVETLMGKEYLPKVNTEKYDSANSLVEYLASTEEFKNKYPNFVGKISNEFLLKLLDVIRFQGQYHPVYSFEGVQFGNINQSCVERCKVIENKLGKTIAGQNIVDIGHNMGYNSFYFAEKANYVLAIDIHPYLIDYCNQLKSELKNISKQKGYLDNVEFVKLDIAKDFEEIFESGRYDTVLLLSIFHQLILQYGLDDMKSFLGNLVKRVDRIFIEFATCKEYEFMPEDLLSIFSQCEDVNIELVSTFNARRPMYCIESKNIKLDNDINITDRKYRALQNFGDRKYLFDNKYFYKCYRSPEISLPKKHNQELPVHNEVVAADLLDNSGFIVPLCSHYYSKNVKILIYERCFYESLADTLSSGETSIFTTKEQKNHFLQQLLNFLITLKMKNLYWNDLSSRNIMIGPQHQFIAVDLENSTTNETLIDHKSYLMMLLLEIETGKHQEPFLPAILSKKTNKLSVVNAEVDEIFFSGELKIVYNLLKNSYSFDDFLKTINEQNPLQITPE